MYNLFNLVFNSVAAESQRMKLLFLFSFVYPVQCADLYFDYSHINFGCYVDFLVFFRDFFRKFIFGLMQWRPNLERN